MNLENINLSNINAIQSEEATKMSLITPFIKELGYDIFNINEVIPEYIADIPGKKGEKVDYAIKIRDKIEIIIEAKDVNQKLTNHSKQLARYFANTEAKIGILTNGLKYKFFTDVDKENLMDTDPFYEFNLEDYTDDDLSKLNSFQKNSFDTNKLYGKAEEMKLIDNISKYLMNEFENPTDKFTKLVLDEIHDGMKTKNIIQEYKPHIKKAITKIIDNELFNKVQVIFPDKNISAKVEEIKENTNMIEKDRKEVITTDNEKTLYQFVRVILKNEEEGRNINSKDNLSYFNVLFDNKINKKILRIYDKKILKIGIFEDGIKEYIYELEDTIDVFKYEKEIISAFNFAKNK